MVNNLVPVSAKISQIEVEDQNTRIYTLNLQDLEFSNSFQFRPGQFIELSLPGFGEAPFSIASGPKQSGRFDILARRVGSLTKKLFQMKEGEMVGIRGPLGNGFPIEKLADSNIVFVSGGCGIAPMRSLLQYIQTNQKSFGQISFLYGCKAPQQLYFSRDYKDWADFADLKFIVEKPDNSWKGKTGMVTDLFEDSQYSSDDKAVVCGPPVMMKHVAQELIKRGIKSDQIFMSLERRMECGIGVCQHCVIGSKYVCKDGPIFSLTEARKEEPNFLE